MTVVDQVGQGTAAAVPVVVAQDVRAATDLRAASLLVGAAASALATIATLLLPLATDLRFLGVVVTGSFPIAWLGAMWLQGAYSVRTLETPGAQVGPVRDAAVRLAALLAVVGFWFEAETALIWAAATVPAALVLDLTGRALLGRRVRRERAAGIGLRRTIVLGGADDVVPLVTRVAGAPAESGIQVVGACLPEAGQLPELLELSVPVIGGGLEAVERAIELTRAQAVVVASDASITSDELRRLAWRLEVTGVSLSVAMPAAGAASGRPGLRRPSRSFAMLSIGPRVVRGPAVLAKSVIDRVAAALGLLLLAPLLLTVMALIRLDTRGPVVFRQLRSGQHGREFTMLKFRTMVVDAEARQVDLVQDNEFDGVLFKMRADPRITSVGRWLRRFSLDELPQLVNVLRGEMSLVGPRPHPTHEAAQYTGDAHRRLLAKPGLTGLWQVSGRSDLSWDESLELDLRYVDEWSLSLDTQLLWRTGRAVVKGTGAY